jgi:hypothetical protein
MEKCDIDRNASQTIDHYVECLKEELSDLEIAVFEELEYGPGDDYEPECEHFRLCELTRRINGFATVLDNYITSEMINKK